jgi:capsular exopolysaccharide synthesis family protein
MSDEAQTEAGIGLRHYLDVLRRRKLTVLLMIALAVGAAALLTLREQSEYKAETTVVVGQGNGLFNPQNAAAIQPFTATMKELLRSTIVAQGVIDDLHLNLTTSQLLNKISVSFDPESALLDVSVVDHVPTQARAVADHVASRFTSLVRERFPNGVPTASGSPPVRAFVWDPAHVVPGRVSPKPTQNLLIAGALGLVLGLLAAFLRDHFDRSLRTRDEIERAFAAPVIGQIPRLRKGAAERPRMLWDENGEFAEAFRGLRANLEYLGVRRPLRSVLVTSAIPNQGKTTVSANLATAVAESGASVALIEADLRRPALSAAFGLAPRTPGLTSVLIGSKQLGAAATEIELPPLQGAPDRAISLLPSGPLPPNPSELVASARMSKLMEGMTDLFDMVILDTPPILPVADTLALAKLVDGVIVVVKSSAATRDDAREVKALVERLELPLVGIVVSEVAVRSAYGAYDSYTAREPELDVPVAATNGGSNGHAGQGVAGAATGSGRSQDR